MYKRICTRICTAACRAGSHGGGRGAACINLPPCGAWVPSVPVPVWVGGCVCVCVSRDSQATTNLIASQITQRNPPRALTPVRPLVAPPSLHGGPPCCMRRPAGQAGSTRRRRQQEPGNGAKGEMRGSWAGRPFMCASQRASVQTEQRKANLAGPAATVEKSMYCTVRCVQASGAIWTSHVPLPRPHEITHQILGSQGRHIPTAGLTDGWAAQLSSRAWAEQPTVTSITGAIVQLANPSRSHEGVVLPTQGTAVVAQGNGWPQ